MRNQAQLDLIADFMTIVDTVKDKMDSQQYLRLCEQAQMAHQLVEYQPSDNGTVKIDDLTVSSRTWRQLKRAFVSEIAKLVQKQKRSRSRSIHK